MYDALITHIQKFVPLTDEEQKLIIGYCSFKEVNKKYYLFSEGDKCNAQYFVIEGCVRLYFIKKSGVEQIIQFGIDNWWISDYTSFTMHTTTQFYLQAVQSSKIIVLKQDKQEELLKKLPKLEQYFRRIYQRAYAAAQTVNIFH